MQEKVTMKLKMNLSNLWLMLRLNLSLDNIRNWRKNYVRERMRKKNK